MKLKFIKLYIDRAKNMQALKKLSIRRRVLWLSITPLVLLSTLLFFAISHQVNSLSDSQLNNARQMLESAEKNKLKQMIQMSIALVKEEYDSGQDRDVAVAQLKQLTFGKTGYIFGYDDQSVRVFSGHQMPR